MTNRLIMTEHPDGRIYVAIEGESDRWDMTERIDQECATADLAAVWDGAHEHHGEITHQDRPAPENGRIVATMTESAITIFHADASDRALEYFGIGTPGP